MKQLSFAIFHCSISDSVTVKSGSKSSSRSGASGVPTPNSAGAGSSTRYVEYYMPTGTLSGQQSHIGATLDVFLKSIYFFIHSFIQTVKSVSDKKCAKKCLRKVTNFAKGGN